MLKMAIKLAGALPILGLIAQDAGAQSVALDTTFLPHPGANAAVQCLAVQPDGKVVLGGSFTRINFTPWNRLGRVEAGGGVDAGFHPGSGADGVVNSVALQADGKILLGGAFTNFNGTLSPRLARLNVDGTLDQGFNVGAGPDGNINFVAALAGGQVLIQGVFRNYQGQACSQLARLNPNGSLDTNYHAAVPNFIPIGSIQAVAALPEGQVLYSGNFTAISGMAVQRLARLDASGALDTNFCLQARLNAPASSIVPQPDGRILLSGAFTNVNGQARSRVARLNADGSLDESFNQVSLVGTVGWSGPRLARQPDGQIILWGAFTNVNGALRLGCARLDAEGRLDGAFSPDWLASAGSIRSVVFQGDGGMLAGNASASSANHLQRFQAGGALDAGWMGDTGSNEGVWKMAGQPDGKFLLGGYFTKYNGLPRSSLVRILPDGQADSGFVPDLYSESDVLVSAILVQPDAKIVVGGAFTRAGGLERTNIARLDADGTVEAAFAGGLGPDGEVAALALQPDGKILAGGYFSTWNEQSRTGLVRLLPNGALDAGFDLHLPPNSEVTVLLRQPDDRILVGGVFRQVNGIGRTNLALLKPDGSLDESFNANPGPDAAVYALALEPGGKILVGGEFNTWNQLARRAVVRLHPDGRLDETFATGQPALDGQVYALQVQRDGRILAGGYLQLDNQRLMLARFNPDGSWDPAFNIGKDFNSNVSSLAQPSDARLLVAGDFSRIQDCPRGGIARLAMDPAVVPQAIVRLGYATVRAGESIGWEAVAVGLPPLTFQWLLDGVPVPGQNALLCQLTNLSPSAAGWYALAIANSFGGVTSAPVRLTVLPASARPGSLDGRFQLSLPPDRQVWSILEQPDGQVVAGGAPVRYHPDGSLDPQFQPGSLASGEVYGLLRLPDGRLLAGGTFTNYNGEPHTNLVCLLPGGQVDAGFAANITGGPEAFIYAMAVQAGSNLVVSGSFTHCNGLPRANLARFHPDGRLDLDFDPAGPAGYAWAMAVLPDQRILLAGDFGLACLMPDGAMDPRIRLTASAGQALLLQPDGRILFGGDGTLLRLFPDGSRDAGFKPSLDDWMFGAIYALALQPDGKLVVAGGPSGWDPGQPSFVARLNPDGAADSSFAIQSTQGGIWALIRLRGGQFLIGGSFTSYGGQPARFLARLHEDEAVDVRPLSLITRRGAGGLEIGLVGEPLTPYRLDISANLAAWQRWTNVVSTGTNWLTDEAGLGLPRRFYRAVSP